MDDDSLDRILDEMFNGEPPFDGIVPYQPPPQQLLEEAAEPASETFD